MTRTALAIPEADRTPAVLTHLSPLAGFLLPTLGNVLGPLVAWLALRDRSPALDQQGKEALNFQLSMWLYGVLIGILAFVLFSLGILGGALGTAAGAQDFGAFAFLGTFAAFFVFFVPLLLLLSIIPFIFMIVAVVRVSAGQPYHYPLSIRFVR
ncbi:MULTISPECIES: DUF4870 domain-containing protein [Deinococcus]|uniref:DUF4870 domain-containing protein n=1 Tax=Deinococcus marmoris TaxID=249408 RepID=A0A1U7NWB4_9DEIO|nr:MULTISPECIES: DUF4870 domain-containing protein [Deinococcus]OLV17204.1 hypothetical protein BOO71_0009535 [Deinococcus marmoris]QFP76839.1 DUF4870 domain-containing protein [Deinococcus sp. AJ005]